MNIKLLLKKIKNVLVLYRHNRPAHYILFLYLFITISLIIISIPLLADSRMVFKSFIKYGLDLHNQGIFNSDYGKLNLSTESYMIYDISNDKEIYSKNKSKVKGLASLSKLMTIYTAKRDCPELAEYYIAPILISSSNSHAEELAELCIDNKEKFIKNMNIYAKQFGSDFVFYNSTGLPNSDTDVGNIGSVNGITRLVIGIDKKYPDLYKYIYKYNHNYINTNPYINKWPFIYFTKTG
ncbi:MAG: hypothetical protein QM532_00200 [Cyanobium sp. MAG06]|nr:hypothetical protein [Cyanobium sp. MAG06]